MNELSRDVQLYLFCLLMVEQVNMPIIPLEVKSAFQSMEVFDKSWWIIFDISFVSVLNIIVSNILKSRRVSN